MNVEFNNFLSSVTKASSFICANTNLNIISCGLGQLLAEPRGTVEGALTGTVSLAVLAIPECVVNKPRSIHKDVVIIASFTEVVLPNKRWNTLIV